jgi:hypothetical protein
MKTGGWSRLADFAAVFNEAISKLLVTQEQGLVDQLVCAGDGDGQPSLNGVQRPTREFIKTQCSVTGAAMKTRQDGKENPRLCE